MVQFIYMDLFDCNSREYFGRIANQLGLEKLRRNSVRANGSFDDAHSWLVFHTVACMGGHHVRLRENL